MTKKNNKIKQDGKWVVITLGVIIGVILLSCLIYGVYLSIKTEKYCREVCSAYGGLYHQRISNGKLNTDDLCICYFDNSIKTWRLGKILE